MTKDIVKRKLQRTAFCRGCDKKMKSGTEVISTYSFRNRGQHIYFCLDCARIISELIQPVKIKPETHPLIWGDGWYAILDDNEDFQDEYHRWWIAPKKFFDEKGHCSDGWEWETPEGMDSDDLEEFINKHGCEPIPPEGFSYCMESCLEGYKNISLEEQKDRLKKAGFILDNIPKWHYERE
jgi:uncharacterized protein YlaI